MTVFESGQTSATLESYSPWLASYVRHAAVNEDLFALEVPGSTENENHPKIVLFDQVSLLLRGTRR